MKRILCGFLFCLFLMFHPGQAQANLVSGTVTNGSISAGGHADYYFTGTSGQGVVLFTYAASYHAIITVYEPSGTEWTYSQDRFQGALPATGTFHVVISGLYSTDSGSFSLSYVIGGGSVSGGTLTSGGTAAGTLTENGIASYQFTATAGQAFQINTSVANFHANIYVYYPNGDLWTYTTNRFAGYNIAQTGTYTVVIYGYNYTDSGSYNLYYVLGNGGVSGGTLTSGGTVNATQPQNGLTSYQFTATAGQAFQINASITNFNANFTVYYPNGDLWTSSTNRFAGYNIAQTGTYTVVIQGSNITDSGTYSLYYVLGGGGTSGGMLTSGGSVNATQPQNGLTSYQFTATAGQGFQINTSITSFNANITVYYPNGDLWTNSSNRFAGYNIAQTGTYTVVIQGNNLTDTGPYSIYLVVGGGGTSNGTLTSGLAASLTQPKNGLTSFSFNATAGQGFQINTSTTSFNATITVYYPNGDLWQSTTNRFNGTNISQTGNYTVVIEGNNLSDTGSYTIYLAVGAGTVSEGSLISTFPRPGTLAENGLNSYQFSGTYGNSLSITTSSSNNLTLTVYQPNGDYWGNATNSYSGTLGYTGQYTLVIDANSQTATGPYTVTLTTTQAAPTASTASKVVTCCNDDKVETPTNATANPAPGGKPVNPPGNPENLQFAYKLQAASTESGNGVGNPVNFDVGYKQEVQTDYSAGGLIFTRIYRSDSTWTNNTIGTLWRHNFARTFSVSGSSASVTDGTGATVQFTLSGSTWVPNDPSTTSTLAAITGGYAYTLADGTVEDYNSSNQLYRITYLGGGALNLTYNGSGQLTTIANENGRQLSLTYDGSGRVSTLVTPDGTFTYAYDSNSNLSTVTRPDTKVRTYLYTNASYVNALTGITDENGNSYATFGYTSGGQANLTEHAGGADEYQIAYNSNGTSTITNPLTKSFTDYFTNLQGVRRVVQSNGAASTNTPASTMYYNYDSLGRVIGTTDWLGNITRYQYDNRGNITLIIQAYATTQQRVTTITPDANFNVPDLITEPGRTTAYAYDTYGRMTSKTITDTSTMATRSWSYAYYANGTDGSGNVILGRLKTVTGPRTDVSEVTTYAYDSNYNLNSITNALSQVTNITAIDASGRPTKIVDPNSVETDLTYDSNGRLQTAVQAVGTALAATTTFSYDAVGNLTKVTLPNSVYVSYSYDNAHRLTGVTDALGNTITYTLNASGNVTQKVIQNTTPTTVYTHTATFDELARLLTSVGASSQTAHYAYDVDSNLTSYTDPNTNATAYAFDPLNRLIKRTDALSGITTPGYDANSDLTSMEDQRSNSTTYTYNGFGDVTGETSPDRGTLTYTVNQEGSVTQRTDARSVVTNYTYDALNRLASISYPSDSSENVTLTYDSTSGCGTAGIGRLCSVTDAAGTTAYQYDVLGRLTQEKDTRGGNNLTTSYSYDLAGTLTGLTLPSGRTVTYTLDSDGRVSGVSATVNGTATTLASSITYLPFGPITGLTYGNSLTLSASFDQDYNPTARAVSSIYSWTYATDSNGNVKQAGSTTYGFDALNRVNAENPGTSVSYTYDATSNRLTKGSTSTTVPSSSNKISAVGGTSYTYDAAGDITAIGSNGYTWNAAGEMATTTASGTTVGTYTYDMFGRRSEKVAASTTYYVYGPGGLPYGEYNTSGALIREYVYLNGAPLAQIDAGSSEVLTYLHTDHLGTPRFGTNTSGSQVWSWTNDAFGVSTPSGTVTINLGMPGQYYDAESGMFYNWNRYYNPAIGRYLNPDPIGIWGDIASGLTASPNSFNYAAQNPINLIDMLGLAIGDYPPAPPGYNPDTWQEVPLGNGKYMLIDPNKNKWITHQEDEGHWRHWDKQDSDNNDDGTWPPNSKKPWPGQKKPPYGAQCGTDPSGDAPQWKPLKAVPTQPQPGPSSPIGPGDMAPPGEIMPIRPMIRPIFPELVPIM